MEQPETRYAQSGEVHAGIQFRDRGAAELKGVPGEWRLFAVEKVP